MKYFSKDRISVMNIHYANYSLEYFLDCQQKLGVKNIEFLAAHQGMWLDHKGYQDTTRLRNMLAERDMKAPVITPENCMYPYQFAVKEKELVRRSFEFFANGIRMGAELGSKIFEANSGWGYWNEPKEEGLKRSADMHRRLCEVADEYGLTIACETLRPQESLIANNIFDLRKLYDMVDHPRFKIMIDTCAMGVAGETLQQWFDMFGSENIIHTHFIDGNPYGHLIWGTGKHDLGEFLQTMDDNGYQGLFSQELTDRSYYINPFSYDQRNMDCLSQYFK